MRLLLVAAIALSSACAHETEFRSDPPGATVLVDGQKIGVTPTKFDDPPGSARIHEVEVRGAERSERFAMKKEGWSVPTIATGVGVGCGTVVLIAAASVGCLFGSALLAPLTGGLSLCLFPIGIAGWFTAILGNVANLFAIPAVAFLLGRTTPDVVLVSFKEGRVTGEPQNLIVPSLAPTTPGESPPPKPPETAIRY
jgi:hypothetical protein